MATSTYKAAQTVAIRWDPEIIPAFPAIALKALKLMSGTDTSLLTLCNLIRADPAFSTAVLRIANSPLVAFSRDVTNVLQASMLLGFQRLRSMVNAAQSGRSKTMISRTRQVFSMTSAGWLWPPLCQIPTRESSSAAPTKR
jgi:HD-like signal output (HDOD) protein